MAVGSELQFTPHPWLRGPHRQTIAGAYIWRRPTYSAVKHEVLLPDGDRLVLHDDRPASWSANGPVATLVHGLAGCHQSGYMSRAAAKLSSFGCRVFRLDMRGCGAGMALARHSLHAGRSDDIAAALRFVAEICPEARRHVVGYSLGASMVLRMLGERDDSALLWVDQAVAVAAPLDLSKCSRLIRAGANRLYDQNFVRTLWSYWCSRRSLRPDLHDRPEQRQRPKSLYEFDAALTAPLGGFADVEDYYTKSSCLSVVSRIRVPTSLLVAWDDPLIGTDVYRTASFSNAVQIHATSGGGHLGFLAARQDRQTDPDWHWMDWRVCEWILQSNATRRGEQEAGRISNRS